MTNLLQQALEQVSKLSPQEQDVIATRLLAELAAEDEFDRKIAAAAHKLVGLAQEAEAEFLRGETLPLDPDKL